VDPLDWVHQWDDFEMMMYAVADDEEGPGVRMQVSRRVMRDGAEEWEILYDRRLGDPDPNVQEEPGTEAWEEAVLRSYLHAHPDLVEQEKAYVAEFLSGRGESR
jgi:hypothetical protein